jgi:hypothetical protein
MYRESHPDDEEPPTRYRPDCVCRYGVGLRSRPRDSPQRRHVLPVPPALADRPLGSVHPCIGDWASVALFSSRKSPRSRAKQGPPLDADRAVDSDSGIRLLPGPTLLLAAGQHRIPSDQRLRETSGVDRKDRDRREAGSNSIEWSSATPPTLRGSRVPAAHGARRADRRYMVRRAPW